MKNVVGLLSAFCFLFFAACTQKEAPDPNKLAVDAVEKFVKLSAGAKSLEDRKALQELSIGELKRAFERMSDKEFQAHYLGEKILLENLSVSVLEISVDRARVRYTVTVTNNLGSDQTKEMNEREVTLSSARGEWFIESVKPVGSDKIAFTNGIIL